MKFENYASIHSLAEAVAVFTDNGDLDKSLRLIHGCVERIITEPLCTSQVYGSRTLDGQCQCIGKTNLATINYLTSENNESQPGRLAIVYIVTKLQKSGGHTRVIEDFIRAQPDAQHIILSTELIGRSDTDYLINGLTRLAKISFEQAPKENLSTATDLVATASY